MAHRVIAIEIDDNLLRAAVVETKLRGFRFQRVISVPFSKEANEEGHVENNVADALNKALDEPLRPSDSLAILYDGPNLFFRRLSFPFGDDERIAATLRFQTLGQLPALPGEIHCAFERIGRESGKTEVLAVSVGKNALSEFLDSLRRVGLEPSHVGVAGLCLAAYLPYVKRDEVPVLLVWAGASRLEMVVARGMRPEIVRVVDLAEPVVHAGEVSPAAMREIVLTTAGASEAGIAVGSVLVTGPACNAFCNALEDVLGVPCKVLDPASLGLPGSENCSGLEPEVSRVVGLALAVSAGKGPGIVNLLTGEFARSSRYTFWRAKFSFIAIVMAIFLALGTAKFVGRVMGLRAERDALQAEVRTLSMQILGKESNDAVSVLKTMKAASQEDIHVFPRWTAVHTLGKVIEAVMAMGPARSGQVDENASEKASGNALRPEDTAAVEIESIRIEPKVVTLRGEADTIETLEAFVQRLKSDQCVREVSTESTDRIQFRRHQGWQRFSLKMEIDCGVPGKHEEEVSAQSAQKEGSE